MDAAADRAGGGDAGDQGGCAAGAPGDRVIDAAGRTGEGLALGGEGVVLGEPDGGVETGFGGIVGLIALDEVAAVGGKARGAVGDDHDQAGDDNGDHDGHDNGGAALASGGDVGAGDHAGTFDEGVSEIAAEDDEGAGEGFLGAGGDINLEGCGGGGGEAGDGEGGDILQNRVGAVARIGFGEDWRRSGHRRPGRWCFRWMSRAGCGW